jgi:hypothetical protein
MEEDFNHLVAYAICERLYFEMAKTNYSSFGAMCQNLQDAILNGLPLSSELYKVLSKTMTSISKLYGFEDEEMAEHITSFLESRKWEEYKECVIVLKNNTKNSFQ